LFAIARSKVRAMPRIPRIIVENNYVNPITLEFPKGVVIYQIKNRFTGRTDYYDEDTFEKLFKNFKGRYDLLMRNPKQPLPGLRNPVTRNPVYPRNVQRVTVARKKKTPSPKTAAKTIQKAVRKHLSKKAKRSRN
jgi:hypothetical protein